MDFNELIKTAHKNAVEKGFYDEPVDDETLKALIIGEAYEALEAHRKGRFVRNPIILDQYMASENHHLFEGMIKDTFGDELADTVIRICDYMGYRKLISSEKVRAFIGIREDSIGRLCNKIALMILGDHNGFDHCLYYIKRYCEINGIPLEKHIEAKLKYNKSRPYKHGKNY
jgi:NTP pyrophosphatase (non-canonical NTP hydrolase)